MMKLAIAACIAASIRDQAKVHYARLLDQVGPDATGRAEIEHARAFVAKL